MNDIYKELERVFLGKHKILDAILPPLTFILLNTFLTLEYTILMSFMVAILFLIIRTVRGEKIGYAFLGLLGVIISLAFVYISKDARTYFLPGILRNIGVSAILFISVLFKRPLAAYSSFLARRWTFGWYLHQQVRPAYSEATLLWSFFFLLKAYVQYFAVLNTSLSVVGIVTFISGFPSTIALLVVTYIFGMWRLKKLAGPSVEEFTTNTPPPWKGQVSGF